MQLMVHTHPIVQQLTVPPHLHLLPCVHHLNPFNYISKTKRIMELMVVLNLTIIDKLQRLDYYIWRPPSLSELTPMIFDMGLTHFGSEASFYVFIFGGKLR